ncbi:MAG: hypothetical protein QF632_05935 [Candidatus Woesearchaeota archaeon]|jgi:hypothetical protein|nr:hypothetical protein [Candidatus Woesearchaeota archaeon]MDP7324272.1 hypothetical protein [Candidatus Woesearchaeota archaeon]MDP7457215.1 hypothetical protein [Candidatus Woesearchaeota archaeon]|tara:strand:- start:1307 stop:1798 length:492 start_codon:yes stop_codon:yes gene_type:complete
MIPKTKEGLEKAYDKCQKRYIKIDKISYKDYFEEALSDLAAADKEDIDKWKIAKAYQALFLHCNGLLVKHAGFYSKDHGCVLIGLIEHKIISEGILKRIHTILEEKKKTEVPIKEDLFNEITRIRIARNKYLYFPKTLRKLKASPKGIIEEIREIIQILSDEE